MTSSGISLKHYHNSIKVKERAWSIYQSIAKAHPDPVIKYAESRGWTKLPPVGLSINPTTLSNAGIPLNQLRKAGLVTKWDKEYYDNHLIFPIYNKDKNVIHFNARNLDKEADLRWLSTEGQPGIDRFFYNSELLFNQDQQRDYLVICEGISDCLSLAQLDVSAIAQFGVHVNLAAYCKEFSAFKGIIAMFDGDRHAVGSTHSGQYKSWEGMLPQLIDLMTLSKTPIYYLLPPDEDGITDINDWLKSIEYSQEEYVAYGRAHLKPIVALAIEMYFDRVDKHELVWRCLEEDRNAWYENVWVESLEKKYGSLREYLIHVYRF
jgi:hypothetical protein